MASRRFFAYDPYDYYYSSPYHHYPYPYYHQHPQQPAAPSRSTTGFFPFAAADAAEPTAMRKAAANPAPRARSVSIPVHFVGSNPEPTERETKAARPRTEPRDVVPVRRLPSAAEAAVRLQAAARGFMARKSVRAVREVEREAEEIGGKIAREAEALRGDARARIAVGEGLMRLLLRLDAVRGAREYRRKVTKRVLALQDAVDALEPKTAPAATVEENQAEPAEENAVAEDFPDAADQDAENEEMEVDGGRADGEPGLTEWTERQSDGGKTDGSGACPEGEWEMVTEEHAAPASPTSAARQELESGRNTDSRVADGVPDVRKVMETVAALCERSAR